MVKIEFSDHSLKQNLDRKIPISRARKTINDPVKVLSSFKGRKLLRKEFADKTLEVVVVEESGKMVVITFYYLKDI